MAVTTLWAASSVSGNAPNPDNAVGSGTGSWSGYTNVNTGWVHTWAMPNPADPFLTAGVAQVFTLRMRKGSNSNNPSFSARILRDGTVLGSLPSQQITSITGANYTLSFVAAEGDSSAGITVEVTVISSGGSGSARNSAEIDTIRWDADTFTPTPPGPPVLTVSSTPSDPEGDVQVGSTVTLSVAVEPQGGASVASILWEAESGPAGPISGASTTMAQSSLTDRGTAVFKVTVTDTNGYSSTGFVTRRGYYVPTALVTPTDLTVDRWTTVTLDGSNSQDGDGSTTGLTYQWSEVTFSGDRVELPTTDEPTLTFLAKHVNTHHFWLKVINQDGQQSVNSTSAVATVKVNDAPEPTDPITYPATGSVAVTSSVGTAEASVVKASVIHQASGAVSLTSTVSGTAYRRLKASGAAPILSTVSGSAAVISAPVHSVTGTVTISSTVSGTASVVKASVIHQASGAVSLTSTVSGSAAVISAPVHSVSGAVSISSAVSGTAYRRLKASGAAPILSTVSGAAQRLLRAVGTAVEVATTVTGNADRVGVIYPASGRVDIVSDTGGQVFNAVLRASGGASAASSTFGVAGLRLPAAGAVQAVSQAVGSAAAYFKSSGSVALTSTVSGSGKIIGAPVHDVSGLTGISSQTSGNASVIRAAVGTAVPVRTASAASAGGASLAVGRLDIVSTVQGSATVIHRNQTAATALTFMVSPAVAAGMIVKISEAAVVLTSSTAAAAAGLRPSRGSVSVQTAVEASLRLRMRVSAAAHVVSTVAGTLKPLTRWHEVQNGQTVPVIFEGRWIKGELQKGELFHHVKGLDN